MQCFVFMLFYYLNFLTWTLVIGVCVFYINKQMYVSSLVGCKHNDEENNDESS